MQQFKYPKRRFPAWLILALLIFGLWWFIGQKDKPRYNKEAEPRVVNARGNLAEDERNTIELFQAASPAVVYITSIEVRRSIFSLNVYEIPQGTGSGFVWDNEGHIVTNYHVIGDASRIEVTLSDNSVRKGMLVGVSPDQTQCRVIVRDNFLIKRDRWVPCIYVHERRQR